MASNPSIGVILGSVRDGRVGPGVADWIMRHAARRDVRYELVDLAEHVLPHLGEPFPPMMNRYRDRRTLEWASVIASFDGFIITTPEYNHGIPGVLKNALDHLYVEWNDKPVGLVGYGLVGGARALDQLRVLVGVLGMIAARPQLELPLSAVGGLAEGEAQYDEALVQLLDSVEAGLS